MNDDQTSTSPLDARRGPGVRFANVTVARNVNVVDITFDVGWNDSWGPGARGEGFSKDNWDAAWLFFKYRPHRPAKDPFQIEIPLEAEDPLTLLLDREERMNAELNKRRVALAGPGNLVEGDPWTWATEVVRTVKTGEAWDIDLRTRRAAPPHRIHVRKVAKGGGFVLQLSTERRWNHAHIMKVLSAPEGAVIELEEGSPLENDSAGVFLHSGSPTFRGDARYRRVSLRLALPDLPLDLDPGAEVEVWPLGLEMVYVPRGPFWLGDPRPDAPGAPQNCFYNALADKAPNRAYHVESEDPIDVGPSDAKGRPATAKQLLWYSNDDDARNAGDHQRIHGHDGISLYDRWSESRIPREFPKGYEAFYLMKRRVTQGDYAAFVNALDGGDTRDSYGQLVRFPWDGTGSHRGTIGLVRGERTRKAERPERPCNHLCWADAMAFAAWAGLRPMTELEYEKACRGPLDPVPLEFSWGKGPVDKEDIRAKKIVGHEDGTEVAVGQANIWHEEPFEGGDGGAGPIRDDAFDRIPPEGPPSTFWLNRAPGAKAQPAGGERERRGLSYYGIAGLTGNLWELTISVGTREGRAFEGTHGAGEVDDLGEAPWQALGWPDQLGKGLSWRGGSWYTHWRRGLVAGRPYGSGAPGFFHRSNDAGFRAARSARSTDPHVLDQEIDQNKTMVRLARPDKLFTWLSPERARAVLRDEAVSAAIFDLRTADYREARESIDGRVGRESRRLLMDRPLCERMKALRFSKRARILAVGDDCLGDRQSFLVLLRHVLEETHGDSMLGVQGAGLRGETTTQLVVRTADMVRDGEGGAPVDLMFCLAGVSDARRIAGLDGTLVGPEETRRNLRAIRKLAEPLVPGGARPAAGPRPRWVWMTPPRIDPKLAQGGAALPFSTDDLARVADVVRAVAAEHPGDDLLDLHAMSLQGLQMVKLDGRWDLPYLYISDHVAIVKAILDLLSPPAP